MTNAKELLECIAIGYAMSSEDAAKRMADVLPVLGWESYLAPVFSAVLKDHKTAMQAVSHSFKLPEPGTEAKAIAYVIDRLKSMNDKQRRAAIQKQWQDKIQRMPLEELVALELLADEKLPKKKTP